MPIQYLKKNKKRKSAFPTPKAHLNMTNQWENKFQTTASSFNHAHHPSQREFFDRPIEVPANGYAHERKSKAEAGAIYAATTPMRSIHHC